MRAARGGRRQKKSHTRAGDERLMTGRRQGTGLRKVSDVPPHSPRLQQLGMGAENFLPGDSCGGEDRRAGDRDRREVLPGGTIPVTVGREETGRWLMRGRHRDCSSERKGYTGEALSKRRRGLPSMLRRVGPEGTTAGCPGSAAVSPRMERKRSVVEWGRKISAARLQAGTMPTSHCVTTRRSRERKRLAGRRGS